MNRTRILFILKQREDPWGGDYTRSLSSGLRNSVSFMVQMLEGMGVAAKMVEVEDNNAIDREVAAYRPTHAIVEAFWVVPEKFDVLMPLHPDVHWIVRNHSETPFLANEGIAFGWIVGYLRRGVEVMCNSPRAMADLVEVARATRNSERLVSYGPNFYPLTAPGAPRASRSPDVLNVGCFGAIRPLKNHMAQAVAAMAVARQRRVRLRFHVNGSRVEGNGAPIVKNLRELFAACPQHDLVEHPWLDHDAFLVLLDSMDIAMQVSFSETFNIVAADAAARGVPLVVSPELPWIDDYAHASPTSIASMMTAIERVLDDPAPAARIARQRRDLSRYCDRTMAVWTERFRFSSGD